VLKLQNLQGGKWATEKVITIPPKEVKGWALPVMPGEDMSNQIVWELLVHCSYVIFEYTTAYFVQFTNNVNFVVAVCSKPNRVPVYAGLESKSP